MTDKYILEGRQAVPCDDLMQWARWFANGTARRVARDSVRGISLGEVRIAVHEAVHELPQVRPEHANLFQQRIGLAVDLEGPWLVAVAQVDPSGSQSRHRVVVQAQLRGRATKGAET